MIEDNKNNNEFEEQFKKKLFENVRAISARQNEFTKKASKIGEFTGFETDLPNISITLNNKIIELQHKFENAGMSIYSKEYGEDGVFGPRFTGLAAIFELIEYANIGGKKLVEYYDRMKEVTEKKVEKIKQDEIHSPIKRAIERIRKTFIKREVNEEKNIQDKTEEINIYLKEYKEINNKIWKYNLKDNLISSIVKRVREKGYSASKVIGLIEGNVIPDLEKLGLADLIPQLKQRLIEEYKKDLPENYIEQIKEEERYLYIPDFNKNSRISEAVNLEINNVRKINQDKIEEDVELSLDD